MSSVAISNASLSPIKNYREAAVRVLAGGQTRTWNVTVDFVAQTGRFSGAQTNGDFVFEGGNRAWISVAIDLFTGRIVAPQCRGEWQSPSISQS